MNIHNLKKKGFFWNILTLISGTGLAQLIAILLQPILRRMYSGEIFGAFAVYSSILGIISTLSTLRYHLAIVLPKKKEDAIHIFYLAQALNFSLCLLLFFIIIIFKNQLIRLLDFPINFSNWLYLLPLSVLLISSYQCISHWLIRAKAFNAVSINKIIRRSSEGITQTGLGFFHLSWGLIIGDIIGHCSNILSGYYQILKNSFQLEKTSKKKIISVAKKYSNFPKYNLIPFFLNTTSYLLPVLFINKLYNANITAQFDLSRQILAVPLTLISVSISQVLLQSISSKRTDNKKIMPEIKRTALILTSVSLVGVIVISFWGAELFSLIFSSKWTLAGEFTQILIFSYVIRFIASPLGIVLIALERLKINAIWQLAHFILVFILFFFNNITIKNFLIIYMVIEIICYSAYFLLTILIVKQYEKRIKTTYPG